MTEVIAVEPFADDPFQAGWHELLLLLAGRLPDDLMLKAREWLALGRWQDVVQAVAFAAVAGSVPMLDDEVDLLREGIVQGGLDSDLVGPLDELRTAQDPGPAWQFVSVLPGPDVDPLAACAPRDLTGLTLADLDPIDRALVEAAADEPAVHGIWSAWRLPVSRSPWPGPLRVVVVTADEQGDSLAEISARLRQAMVVAGDDRAQVEVCAAGLAAPRYQSCARWSGSLLWAAEPAVPAVMARVFDVVQADLGPRFAADRPVVDDPLERAELLSRLAGGMTVLWVDTHMVDVIDPARGAVVPLHFRTDGSWIWTDTIGYYLAEHGLAPDPALVRHLTGTGAGGEPDEVRLHRVMVQLLSGSGDPAVWTVQPDQVVR